MSEENRFLSADEQAIFEQLLKETDLKGLSVSKLLQEKRRLRQLAILKWRLLSEKKAAEREQEEETAKEQAAAAELQEQLQMLNDQQQKIQDFLEEDNEIIRRKAEEDRLTRQITIRLKQKEYDVLQELATKGGTTKAQMIRMYLFNNTAGAQFNLETFPPQNEDRKELIRQLYRIGNNLNQLAHHYNATGERPPKELAAAKELAIILKNNQNLF